MSAERLHNLIDDYLDRTLSDDDRAELQHRLMASQDARRAFWRQVEFHTLVRKAVLTRAGARLALDDEPVEAPPPRPEAPTPSRRLRRSGLRRRTWIAATLTLLVLLSLSLWARGPRGAATPPLARLENVAGEVYLVDGEKQTLVRPGQTLAPGQGLRTVGEGSGASIVFADSTRLDFDGDTTVAQLDFCHAEADAGGFWKQVALAEGLLRVDVPEHPQVRPVVVRTPHAHVSARGAKVTVAHEAESTDVDVERGSVNLTRSGKGDPVVVDSGHYVVATPGNEPFVPTPASNVPHAARATFEIPRGPVTALAVSGDDLASVTVGLQKPAGRVLLLHGLDAKRDPDVKQDPKPSRGEPQRVGLKGHKGIPQSLAFTPAGRLAVILRDGTLIVRGLSGNEGRAKQLGPQTALRALSTEGSQFVTLEGPEARLWEVAHSRELRTVRLANADSSEPVAVAMTSTAKLIATAHRDGAVRLWDLSTGEPRGTLAASNGAPIRSIAFSHNGSQLAVAVRNCVHLWDVADGSERNSLCGHRRPVMAVAFSRDGKTLATAGQDRTVKLWDLPLNVRDNPGSAGAGPRLPQ